MPIVKDETNPRKIFEIDQENISAEQALLAVFLREVIHRDEPHIVDMDLIESKKSIFKPQKTFMPVQDRTNSKKPLIPVLKMWRFYVESPEQTPVATQQ